MNQYNGYDRKHYEKYDKQLDGSVSISEAEQKWLDANKPAYQLDLLKDSLSKRNATDIKELS